MSQTFLLKFVFLFSAHPRTTLLSVELNSPQPLRKSSITSEIPIAKPRSIATKLTHFGGPPKYSSSLATQDSLKIIKETRGARQLRDHELSYFGVPTNSLKSDDFTKPKPADTNRETRKYLNVPPSHTPQSSQKPDLLRHCSIIAEEEEPMTPINIKPAERKSLKLKTSLDPDEEHIYENIAKGITTEIQIKAAPEDCAYDRRCDFQRDWQILNEMNQNADQTLQVRL